jgi:hypothetical protein
MNTESDLQLIIANHNVRFMEVFLNNYKDTFLRMDLKFHNLYVCM